MFAQIYAFQFDPSQAESHVKFVEQVVASDLRRQPGFKGMQLLIDRERGRALGVSYWASEATARAAAERSANPPAPLEGVQVLRPTTSRSRRTTCSLMRPLYRTSTESALGDTKIAPATRARVTRSDQPLCPYSQVQHMC